MCLGVPMQVRSIEGFQARCETKGIERDVSLFLLQGMTVAPGDYVLVHVGYAIQKLEPEDAALTWELLDELFESAEPAGVPLDGIGPDARGEGRAASGGSGEGRGRADA